MVALTSRGENPAAASRLTPAQLDANFTALNTGKLETSDFRAAFIDAPLSAFAVKPAAALAPTDLWPDAAAKLQSQIAAASQSVVGNVVGGVPIGGLIAGLPGQGDLVTISGAHYLKSGVTALKTAYPLAPSATLASIKAGTLPGATTLAWYHLAYGNGVFTSVSFSSTAVAASSTDGLTWTERTMPVAGQWNSLAYGNGLFFAAVYNTTIGATSPDGITWTQRVIPNGQWQTCAFGAGLFVLVGAAGTDYATSPDGITWTARNFAVSDGWRRIIYGGGKFVIASEGGTYALSSVDGINWTTGTMPAGCSGYSLTYGNGLYVTAGNLQAKGATSPDGVTWTQRTLPAASSWRAMGYAGGLFHLFIGSSTGYYTSPDGLTWTSKTLTAGVGGFFAITVNDAIYMPSVGSPGVVTVVTPAQEVVDNLVALFADGATQNRPFYMRVK